MARGVEQNYRLNVQGAVLLNWMPDSTSIPGNALEVANTHLNLTTTTSNAAEDIYLTLGATVKQPEETLQQA